VAVGIGESGETIAGVTSVGMGEGEPPGEMPHPNKRRISRTSPIALRCFLDILPS